jgi:hypothetical protein
LALVVASTAVSAAACAGPGQARPTPSPTTSSTPLAQCRTHLANVIDAQTNTVQGVTEVGPRPTPTHPGHLGTYTGAVPVTLCLVRKPGIDDAVAITPDGLTHVVWSQGGSDHLEPPS